MSFKYHVVEETYRDGRRMAPGEVWVTDEEIHNSRALYPADEATEEAYLKAFPEDRVRTVDHATAVNPFTGTPVQLPNRKFGVHTNAIKAARKQRLEEAKKAEQVSKMVPPPPKGERASDKL